MPNIFEPDFNQRREHPGFRALRARLGWELGTERLGASIWEIEPGEAAYPYHYHLAEEELLVVLLGRPSVRSDGEWRELTPGDVLSFPRGPRAAHQIANWGDVTARFLAVSTSGAPDLVVYPDSRKLGAFERLPDRQGCSRSSGWTTRSTTTRASGHPCRRRRGVRRAANWHTRRVPIGTAIDYRRSMQRFDVSAIALGLVAAVFGISAGTGPLAGGLAALVLAGLALRARSAEYIAVWADCAAARLGHLSGSVDDRRRAGPGRRVRCARCWPPASGRRAPARS